MRQFSRLLVALLLAGGSCFAADKVEIVHKPDYAPGTVYRQVTETKIDQTLVLAGMNIPTKVESYSATRDTVEEPTADGKTQLHGEFEYFIVNLETPIGNYAFDSSSTDESPNTPPLLKPLDDLFRATASAKWISTVNSKPEFEAIAFDGDPFDELESSAKSEVTPERFQHEYNTQLRRFPDAPVAVGDTWKRSEESQIGNGQWLKFDKEFTYLGAEDRGGKTVDKISVKSVTAEYGIGAESQLPLKLENSELKIASSEGMMIYDRQHRMITETSEKVQTTGKLEFTIDINGNQQKVPGELDLTIDAKHTAEPPPK